MSTSYFDKKSNTEIQEICLAHNIVADDRIANVKSLQDFDIECAHKREKYLLANVDRVNDIVLSLTKRDLMVLLEVMGMPAQAQEETAVMQYFVKDAIRQRATVQNEQDTYTLRTLRDLLPERALAILENTDDRAIIESWYMSACPPGRRKPISEHIEISKIKQKIESYLQKYWCIK
jgi:hypothetical protein